MTNVTTTTNAVSIQAEGLWKQFGNRHVVQDVSLSLRQGDVVGFVGPNGAGKTTTIRMLLNIISPDRGSVRVFGQQLDEALQTRIGYLPEERGLYRGQRVSDIMAYLGQLRGMTRQDAQLRVKELLERVGMEEHVNKKLSELSRGMSQLVQFAACVVHKPDVIILDEPFSGLDPVNVRLLKDFVAELGRDGAAIMFSTHQMEQVEELCDWVTMINEGRIVLDGSLRDIKRQFRGDTLLIACDPWPEDLDGITDVRQVGDAYQTRLLAGVTPEHVLRQLVDRTVTVERFEVAVPSMEAIFLSVVGAPHA